MPFAEKTYKLYREKHRMHVLLFFVLSCFFIQVQGQTSNDVKKQEADSLITLSKAQMKKGEFDQALLSAEKSIAIFTSIEEFKLVGDCYNQMATISYAQGEYYQSLSYFEKSRASFEKANHLNGVASATNNKGVIFYYLGNYIKALENYKKALEFHEKMKNENQIAGTTQNIGNIYFILNDFTNARKNFETAEEIYRKKNNEKALALVLSSIGNVYKKEGNNEKALEYYNSSLELAKHKDEKRVQAEVLSNLGKLYEVEGDYRKSVEFYNQSLLIAREAQSKRLESTSLIALGAIQLIMGNKNKAIENCKDGLDIAQQIDVVSIQEEACECLYNAYKAKGIAGKALMYNEKMHLLKDSLNLKQTTDKILNMKFEKELLLDSIADAEIKRKAELAHQQEVAKKVRQRNIFLIAGCFAILIAIGIFSRLNLVKRSKARLQVEKDRSEHLLLNILPEEIAEELKEKGYVDAQNFETASILFTDFKSFTQTASQLTARELVQEINACFKAFDQIMGQYKIEKIKTIGDAYMAAGGLPQPDVNAVKNTILAALDMQTFIKQRHRENQLRNQPAFEMRVGIHVGPIVAGIVGVKKFQYDVWGDTVNTASRMESNGAVGRVNISHHTYELVKDEADLLFEYRGEVEAKGKGKLKMYFVELKTKPTSTTEYKTPPLEVSVV